MSAFVVSRETINCVCSCWFEGGWLRPSEERDDVGRRLWAMNIEAVHQRYPRDNPEQLPGTITTPKPESFSYSPKHYGRCQQLKALHCLKYQCTEGNVPESALYAELSQKADRLAAAIACNLPDYKRAEWCLT